MVNICGICNGELRYITDVPGSSRGNSIHVCNQCAMLQLVGSPEYEASKDPHSLRYSGTRHVAAASGAMWGNIRHGKGLRFDAHLHLLEKALKLSNPQVIFDDGANRGHFARYVQKNYPDRKYIGYEPDPICFESYIDNDTPAIVQDYTENFEDDIKVDFLYSAHTLEHVDSVKIHMEKLYSIMNDGATIFLDLPNAENINYEEYIFEEFFVEKEISNFMLEDVLNILIHSGFAINQVASDPFNLTVIGKKNSEYGCDLTKIHGSQKKIDLQIKNVLNYYKKMELTNQIFSSACQKINEFKKDQEIIIYGGGRLLLGFFDSGLENDNIIHIIDNYLFDKTKSCNGLPLKNESVLDNSEKSTPIIVFARSSTENIISNLNSKGFDNVQPFSNFI